MHGFIWGRNDTICMGVLILVAECHHLHGWANLVWNGTICMSGLNLGPNCTICFGGLILGGEMTTFVWVASVGGRNGNICMTPFAWDGSFGAERNLHGWAHLAE